MPRRGIFSRGWPHGIAGNGKLVYCAADSTKKRPRLKKRPGTLFPKCRAQYWQRPTLAQPIDALPSALQRFTSVFGMGTGGATAQDHQTMTIRFLKSPGVWRHPASCLKKNNRRPRPPAPDPLRFFDIRTLGERLQLHQQQDCKMEKKAERVLVSLS